MADQSPTRTVTEERWAWQSPRYGVWVPNVDWTKLPSREQMERECSDDETVVRVPLTYEVPNA